MPEAMIECDRLTKRFGHFTAVDQVSFRVEKGSIFGFLGALVHYGRRTGSSHIGQAGLQYALFMGVMGFIFPGVDNAAHLGGFAGGYLTSLILDPLKKERVDHIVAALVCLALTFVALVVTLIKVIPLLG